MDKVYKIILFFLFLCVPFSLNAATLSFSPSSGVFEVGKNVTVKVIVTSDIPFNAVSGVFSFPSSIFSVESISKTSSILNFWVTEPIVSKTEGTIKFEGVTLGGFSGSTGTVITVNLRAKETGEGKFSFQSGQILANDGEGTNIIGNLIGAIFSVKEVKETEVKPIIPLPTPEPESLPVSEVSQPAPTLKAPEISLGTKYGAPAVLGMSDYPKAQTLITFVAQDGTKIFILGVAEADGNFNVLIPNSLKHGSYTVTAVMIKDDKTNSDSSNMIVVKIGNIISDITWEVWIFIILLLLAILYLIIRIYSHFGQDKEYNKRELCEAENIVHKSFDILREDISLHNKKGPTVEEKKDIFELKKDINDAEKIITKEIKDIESV